MLLALIASIQLALDEQSGMNDTSLSTENNLKPDRPPLFGHGSESVPAYAVYSIADRRWAVDCYSIGPVFVTPDATSKFRGSDGAYLSHEAFCDLYL